MERFFSKAQWNFKNGCLEWIRGKSPGGYGEFYYKGKTRRAHRVAYELAYGEFDDSLLVRHKCDNKICVNYRHLILGTNADNSSDNAERGLMPRGEDQWSAKLTEDTVLNMRYAYASGETSVELAEKYQVHRATVASVCYGRIWKHVGGPIAERTKRQRLTDNQVAAILDAAKTMTDQAVAEEFGVSQPYVTRLKNGKRRNVIRPQRDE